MGVGARFTVSSVLQAFEKAMDYISKGEAHINPKAKQAFATAARAALANAEQSVKEAVVSLIEALEQNAVMELM